MAMPKEMDMATLAKVISTPCALAIKAAVRGDTKKNNSQPR
jgi:hypothetical protein